MIIVDCISIPSQISKAIRMKNCMSCKKPIANDCRTCPHCGGGQMAEGIIGLILLLVFGYFFIHVLIKSL